MSSSKKDEREKLLMEILLDSIKPKRKIRYGEIQKEATKRNKKLADSMHRLRHIPNLLGRLNKKILCHNNDAPTISAIVVNKEKEVPGPGINEFPGFYGWEELCKKKDYATMRKLARKAQAKVFAYPYQSWKKIYKKLFC